MEEINSVNQSEDRVAVVVSADNGHAKSIKLFPASEEEIHVFAHGDMVYGLEVGDWVRFDYTDYGALIVECIARLGRQQLLHLQHRNSSQYLQAQHRAVAS